jgi:excisionase family DNA binding protein
VSEFLTTKEVADLLRLKERKVYDLAAKGEIPCVKATGKLLFPRSAIEHWMGVTNPLSQPRSELPQVVLGSHDPLLEWALSASGASLPTLFSGSHDGLRRMHLGEGIACGLHIANDTESGWNTECVKDQFSSHAVVLVRWATRARGLIIRPSTDIQGLASAAHLRWVVRQSGTGSQTQLQRLLASYEIAMDQLKISREASTETEAALAIVEHQADVTFGLQCFAERYQLKFIPITEESFDLLIDRHAFCDPAIQRLFKFARTPAFIAECQRYAGYDMSAVGSIVFNSPRMG